jgi:excisionase family DNA binding protein
MNASVPLQGQTNNRSSKTSRNALSHEIQTLLKAKEAAHFLNVSEHTIRMWIWQRRLPVVRLGRAVRLRREDLELLIKQNREEAVSL